jgi:hypothetical protein
MGPRTGLDGCGNITSYRDLIPGRSSPRLGILPALSWPTRRDGRDVDAVQYFIDSATLNVSASAETVRNSGDLLRQIIAEAGKKNYNIL